MVGVVVVNRDVPIIELAVVLTADILLCTISVISTTCTESRYRYILIIAHAKIILFNGHQEASCYKLYAKLHIHMHTCFTLPNFLSSRWVILYSLV